MIKDFNFINWHDAKMLAFIEDCESDRISVTMDMDVSLACDGSVYAEKNIIFYDTSRFSVDEGPVSGCPVIIGAAITEEIKAGESLYRVVFDTNAGQRVLYARRFTIRDCAQQGDAPEPATHVNPA